MLCLGPINTWDLIWRALTWSCSLKTWDLAWTCSLKTWDLTWTCRLKIWDLTCTYPSKTWTFDIYLDLLRHEIWSGLHFLQKDYSLNTQDLSCALYVAMQWIIGSKSLKNTSACNLLKAGLEHVDFPSLSQHVYCCQKIFEEACFLRCRMKRNNNGQGWKSILGLIVTARNKPSLL